MTNSEQNEPVGTTSFEGGKANWGWLQGRVGTVQTTTLHEWLSEQLVGLEDAYAAYVTPESLKLSLRSELRQGRQ